jgi:protein tyrosine phosphatase (PTP) superfamily phosphohydrolase (DUF442 family)
MMNGNSNRPTEDILWAAQEKDESKGWRIRAMGSTIRLLWFRYRHCRLLVQLTILTLVALAFPIRTFLTSSWPQIHDFQQQHVDWQLGPLWKTKPVQQTSYIDLMALQNLVTDHKGVQFSRCNVNVKIDHRMSRDQNRTTILNDKLPDFIYIDMEKPQEEIAELLEDVSNRCEINMTFPPVRKKPDASHMIFGVATTLERLKASVDTFAHWAGGTGATMVARCEPDEKISIDEIELKARAAGFNLSVQIQNASWDDRYFELTQVLFEEHGPKVQWAVVMDDDTFFPSMPKLVEYLGKFDATKPHYIGGISEDYWATCELIYLMLLSCLRFAEKYTVPKSTTNL